MNTQKQALNALVFLYDQVLEQPFGTLTHLNSHGGHRDVSTTMIYTHVLNQGGLGVRSPLDLPG